MSIEHEVDRILVTMRGVRQAVALPRTEMQLALDLGRRLSMVESDLRGNAHEFGGSNLVWRFDEALIGGASDEELEQLVTQGAERRRSELVRSVGDEAGAEADRLLREARRR